MMRLLRPPHIGIFPRSLRLHGAHHAREMIVEICSMWDIALRSPCSAQARGDHPCVARATHSSHPRDGDHYSDRLLARPVRQPDAPIGR